MCLLYMCLHVTYLCRLAQPCSLIPDSAPCHALAQARTDPEHACIMHGRQGGVGRMDEHIEDTGSLVIH